MTNTNDKITDEDMTTVFLALSSKRQLYIDECEITKKEIIRTRNTDLRLSVEDKLCLAFVDTIINSLQKLND